MLSRSRARAAHSRGLVVALQVRAIQTVANYQPARLAQLPRELPCESSSRRRRDLWLALATPNPHYLARHPKSCERMARARLAHRNRPEPPVFLVRPFGVFVADHGCANVAPGQPDATRGCRVPSRSLFVERRGARSPRLVCGALAEASLRRGHAPAPWPAPPPAEAPPASRRPTGAASIIRSRLGVGRLDEGARANLGARTHSRRASRPPRPVQLGARSSRSGARSIWIQRARKKMTRFSADLRRAREEKREQLRRVAARLEARGRQQVAGPPP